MNEEGGGLGVDQVKVWGGIWTGVNELMGLVKGEGNS